MIQVEGGFCLRPLATTDAAAFQEAFSEEESARYFTQQRLQGFRDAKTLVEWLCESGEYYVILRQSDAQVIGLVGTRERKEAPEYYESVI